MHVTYFTQSIFVGRVQSEHNRPPDDREPSNSRVPATVIELTFSSVHHHQPLTTSSQLYSVNVDDGDEPDVRIMPSSMPSPIAINPTSPSPSMFRKKKSLKPMSTAASYLSAVSEADARARIQNGSPTSTPALSLSSSITSSSEDTVLDESNEIENGLNYPGVPPTSEQIFTTVHTEFGHCGNEAYRFTSGHPVGEPVKAVIEQDPPYYILLTTYISYILVIILGHIRDFFGKRLKANSYKHLMFQDVRSLLLAWAFLISHRLLNRGTQL